MLKKLGIAAACGIALYGLARLIQRHTIVVTMPSGNPLEIGAADFGAVDDAAMEDRTLPSDEQGSLSTRASADGAGLVETCTGEEQVREPDGEAQAAPCL